MINSAELGFVSRKKWKRKNPDKKAEIQGKKLSQRRFERSVVGGAVRDAPVWPGCPVHLYCPEMPFFAATLEWLRPQNFIFQTYSRDSSLSFWFLDFMPVLSSLRSVFKPQKLQKKYPQSHFADLEGRGPAFLQSRKSCKKRKTGFRGKHLKKKVWWISFGWNVLAQSLLSEAESD